MNQTHRATIQERKKKRRQYLRKKAIAHLLSGGYSLVSVGTILTALIIGIVLLTGGEHSPGHFITLLGMVLAVGFMATWVLEQTRKFSANAKAKAKRYYAAPVKVATLPSEDVLLRGAGSPAIAPGELLRAAHKGPNAPANDLLRPSNEGLPGDFKQTVDAPAEIQGVATVGTVDSTEELVQVGRGSTRE